MFKPILSNRTKMCLLLLGSLLVVALYLAYGLPKRWQYALNYRLISLSAIGLTAIAIAFSTMIFQALVNNRILTPSILGLDWLYVSIQLTIIFLFGADALTQMDPQLNFLLSGGIMTLFSLLFYYFLFKREQANLFFLLLVGIIFGTFFQSLTTFMEVLIDPNEFQILQDASFASFNKVNSEILWLAAGLLCVVIGYAVRYLNVLDVLVLGRDQAINLGVDYRGLSKRLLIVVAILTSIATALVGPITFLGLLVMNLTLEFIHSHRYRVLLPAAILLAVISLIGGQFVVSQLLNFSTTLSVIINFIGGIYFIYLLLRRNQ
ncbi:iron chelate uptake ABC transporter family permease subunit [Testudinibacter sp. TR-2022]|uniref:iron chelate uptake ABC transporter family permease subunit n=1 Tax=Testudinibacter sp. TR-2022 TaxID=2585029 RepID=UPI0011191251|nr:iron chelate uptake ABC transporter family permease subunit [Testudinibacter sp. TR-2022]TNH03863.1 iron chelate uptake ABC transporter family permease subunit [Pasteurellaceae bacterium Phil31]TNH08671.1 iron chelate uptake ABC transporter family permease subunit [Testudinibacter sp. TR-2022]TNH08754.1 iron chelate uptake ABC transporter family permease subunit [Testudinibacter sp. TR-2022]TNH14838.1 iron chelate uptake ABC transporter family permease subunit [Testudinibacter sp. TR-2022]T